MTPEPISESLRADILRMPKVELHVHLEGATDAETVWEMARRNDVGLPAESLEQWKTNYKFRNFEHFIDIYTLASATMRTADDWVFMVKRFLENQAAQNIVYSEVFIAASHQRGVIPLDEWIDALVRGAVAGEAKTQSKIKFIVDISRQWPDTQNDVLQCAIDAKKTGYIIGLGLGGIETNFPPSMFVKTYEEARRQGLHVVAHAGETTGPDTIRDSIDLLQVERIGHGIRCLDDPSLVKLVRESQIPFEVCPTSNYCLGVANRDEPHPIRKMVDAGVYCTVNSDDPPMFDTTLIGEYELLAQQGFSWQELRQLNLNAINACYLTEEAKAELREQI